MATTPEYNLYHPVTGTLVKPASADFEAMQVSVEAGLKMVRQQASWFKGTLPSATDLNTWLEVGVRNTETSTITGTILNRPPGFNQPFTIEVIPRSVVNGIYRQVATMKTTGVFDSVEVYRDSLLVGGVVTFGGEWLPAGKAQTRDNTLITILGDSQSERTATSWDQIAGPLLDGATFINHARSGDGSNAVLLREGAITLDVRVVGGNIQASGSVDLTTSQRLYERDDRILVGGTLAGVAGTLMHVAGDTYRFTRSSSGAAVAVPGWSKFVSSWGTGGSAQTNAHALIGWFGGNDFNFATKGQSRTIADHIIGNYRRFVEHCYANGYKPIIAGVTNRLTALAGSDGFAQVQRINRTLRMLYPDIFLDVQAYYVERAIYDAGLTPTAGDLAAIGRGEIPPQLYLAGDDVHLKPAAHAAIGEYWIAPWLAAQGYALTTIAQKPLADLHPADMDAAA